MNGKTYTAWVSRHVKSMVTTKGKTEEKVIYLKYTMKRMKILRSRILPRHIHARIQTHTHWM